VLEERFEVEVKKNKQALMASEKLKRERWEKEKM
jgi:hypothetical protein